MIDQPQDSPWLTRLPACFLLLACGFATGLPAQVRQRATTATPFHKDPRGIQLGTLVAGAQYATGPVQGTWVEATVAGWIWTASVQPTSRDGFDLAVTSANGEVVRSSPNGPIVARLVTGTLLRKVGARGAWTQVSRTGWVPGAALASAQPPAPPPAAPVRARTGGLDPPPTVGSPADTASAPAPSSGMTSAPADSAPPRERVTVRRGTELAPAPDGAPIARFERVGDAEILERSREWVRVRVDGWVRAEDLGGAAVERPAITGAMLREQPDQFVGRTVTWRVHFLSHQTADDLRPEIPRGQRYLLARGPLPESGFVYVTLTPRQAAELEGLRPLDEIRIEGVIRAARTRFLPTPVVELVRVVELR